jgi:hypothetical protein
MNPLALCSYPLAPPSASVVARAAGQGRTACRCVAAELSTSPLPPFQPNNLIHLPPGRCLCSATYASGLGKHYLQIWKPEILQEKVASLVNFNTEKLYSKLTTCGAERDIKTYALQECDISIQATILFSDQIGIVEGGRGKSFRDKTRISTWRL